MSTVYVKWYEAPPVDRREILRYAGVRGEAPETEALLENCLEEVRRKLTYGVCFGEYPLERQGEVLELGFTRIRSGSLSKHLEDCERVVLFAATVGRELDRLIYRYGHTEPSRALLLQAIGAERIEALCDAFCAEIAKEKAKEGACTRSRFSPGYGDCPLELQREIFRVLDASKRIGLSLNESMLMSPSKSVTAMIGVSHGIGTTEQRCNACNQQDCEYRRTI